MNSQNTDGVEMKKLPSTRRSVINVGQQPLVKEELLGPDTSLPLVVRPAVSDVDLISWARNNLQLIESRLLKHGAVLFRGFNVTTVEDFGRVVQAVVGDSLEYRERSSPRSQVADRIYTSTDYPADQSIFPHNEHSYSKVFPLKLFFFCLVPAQQMGETPIADCRKVFRRLDPRLRDRFVEKKWMYVRNFGDGFGLPWQTVFQTDDKRAVEEYCREAGIEVEWKEGDRLRTRQVRPVVATHPKTGEQVWFNHATFFHVTTLPPPIRSKLLSEFEEEDLPNNTYYGDGSPIEPEVLDELREAYLQELVTFTWQKGDVIVLDNMLTAHSRSPYVGPRKILFAMGEPYRRQDV